MKCGAERIEIRESESERLESSGFDGVTGEN